MAGSSGYTKIEGHGLKNYYRNLPYRKTVICISRLGLGQVKPLI